MSKQSSSHRLSKQELRASFLLPIAITVGVWLIGTAVYVVSPLAFNETIGVVLGITLVIFLLWWTREARWQIRLTAVICAIPALIGLVASVVTGILSYMGLGLGATLLLLIGLRFWQTPLSYRSAYARYQQGDYASALRLINKSIDARPDFWESYELRALLRMLRFDFANAVQDVQNGLTLKPDNHQLYNSLGQIYLAQNQFELAHSAYEQAVSLEPQAIYQYYLGLCQYRLEAYETAVAHLTQATQGTLPFIAFDLWCHFYLAESLQKLGRVTESETVLEAMSKFREGVTYLKEQIEQQPDYPHMTHIRHDFMRLEERLYDTQ